MTTQSALTAYSDTRKEQSSNDSETTKSRTEKANTGKQTIESMFDSLESWKTAVKVNDGEWMYVGGKTKASTDTYRVYHFPEAEKTGIAGYVRYNPGYLDTDEQLLFSKSLDNESSFTEETAIDITNMEVNEHSRCKELTAVLPLVRTRIMDGDWIKFGFELSDETVSETEFMHEELFTRPVADEKWVGVDPDVGYSDWGTASVPITRFYTDEYRDCEEISVAINENALNSASVQHSLGRYPMDGRTVMSNIENRFVELGCNPEAFRTLIFDFAAMWTKIESCPVTISNTMKMSEVETKNTNG